MISQMTRHQVLFHLVNVSCRAFGIKKFRHRLHRLPGVSMLVDEFQRDPDGLTMAEAKLRAPDLSAAFAIPDFAVREITDRKSVV